MAYIFGGGTGETAESLKRKREWVQSMLESAIGQQPQNIGDGIAVVGRALAGRLGQAVLNKREREGTAAAMKAAGGNSYIRDLLLGNVGGSGAEISGTGGASTLAGSAGRDKLGPISPDLSARADYIREAAARIGVDPEIAVRVARSEGLAKGVWQSNYHKNGKRETSYGPFQLLVGGGLGDKFIRETGLDPRDPSTERAQVDFALRQAKAGGWSPWYGAAKVGVGKWDGIQRGNNTLPGGEGNDMLMDGWGQPDPNRPGHGINTQTGAPASFSQPDPARYGGPSNMPAVATPYAPNADPSRFGGPFPKSDRMPQPQMAQPDPARFGPPAGGMPQFNPMMAQGPMGPQSLPPDRPMPSGPIPQPQMAMPQQAPAPQPRPQMAPRVDPMQTAAVPQQMMRPRGIVSPRAEDNGYTRGPGAAPQNMMSQQGGQGGWLLGRLLSRQPMPQGGQAGQPVSGTGGQATAPGGGGNDELMQMYALLDNPYLPESYRAALLEALKQKQAQADPVYQQNLQKGNLEIQKAQRDLNTDPDLLSPEALAQKQALAAAGKPETNVTVGGEPGDGELRRSLDKKTGEIWAGYQETGATAGALTQDMEILDELIKIAPQGPIQGRLAEMLPGFSSAGAAFTSIVKRIAPTLRAPGSGSTSDIEYDGMIRSLPMLSNKPEANATIAQILKSKAALNIERARIVDAYGAGEISAAYARKMIGELDKRSIMTPEMKKLLAGLAPQVDEDGYSVEEIR